MKDYFDFFKESIQHTVADEGQREDFLDALHDTFLGKSDEVAEKFAKKGVIGDEGPGVEPAVQQVYGRALAGADHIQTPIPNTPDPHERPGRRGKAFIKRRAAKGVAKLQRQIADAREAGRRPLCPNDKACA